jgi:hypothetical protein
MAGPAAFGPYHRFQTRKQTAALALVQQAEGRVCGKPPNWGGAPSVKAYPGPLAPRERGVEFSTDLQPSFSSTPYVIYWREGDLAVTIRGEDMVCIPVVVTRIVS